MIFEKEIIEEVKERRIENVYEKLYYKPKQREVIKTQNFCVVRIES